MKINATSKLENWLEEDEDINQKLEFDRNSFYNEEEEVKSLRNKREDEPWVWLMIDSFNNDIYDVNESLKVENLTCDDYEEICKRLGRKPNRTELGMFGV